MDMLKSSSIVVTGILISNVLAYIFHIYVGRALGPVDYGVFGALLSILTILSLISTAFGSAIVKFTARLNEKKQYEKIGFLRKAMQKKMLIFGVIFLLLIILLSQNIADYLKIESNIPVIIMVISLFFALISPVNRGVLQGLKKFKVYSWNGILESVSRLIIVIVLLSLGFGISGSIIAYGLGYFIAFLAIFPFIKETKIQKKYEKNKEQDLAGFYRFVVLVFFVTIALQLLINLPTIFIKHFLSSEFTGYWTAALTLARATLFVTGGILIVMFPEVAGEEKAKEKKLVFKKALILTLLVSVGIALIFLIIPNVFITLLYGKNYAGAVPILRWMGVAMIGVSVLQLSLNYWLAKRA